MPIFGMVAGDELIKVRAFEWVGLEGEVYVCAEVVDPKCLCPRCFAGRLAVEEKDMSRVGWIYTINIRLDVYHISSWLWIFGR